MRADQAIPGGPAPAPPPTIDVVVPVYGKWELTRSCLRHLKAQTAAHRVILVDDESPDETLVRVRAEFPHVDVVEMEGNSGFAAACNRGIQHGSAEIVVLLNNDVDAAPDLLAELAGPFVADRNAGSVAALLLRPDGRVDSFGICADPTMAGFVRGHGAALGTPGSPLPTLLGPYGAAAAYRRAALDGVGLLDEGIRMYGEELDLALRLRSAGWGAVAAERARGVHVGGATAGRGSARQRYLAGFGRGYLLRSHVVLNSRYGPRAAITESLVCVVGLAVNRDAADLQGRVAGWRAARKVRRGSTPPVGVDRGIGFVRSLRMRTAGYWSGSAVAPDERSP